MNDEENVVYIYVLSDPRDGRVRYVGQSKDPEKRYRGHKKGWDNVPKRLWFRELRGLGMKPELDIIDCASDGTHNELEAKWIKHYLDSGHDDLLNLMRHKTGYPNIKNPRHLAPAPQPIYDDNGLQDGENWLDTFSLHMDELSGIRSIAVKLSECDWGCYISSILGGDIEAGFIVGLYMPQLVKKITSECYRLRADVRIATDMFNCHPNQVFTAFQKCLGFGIEDVVMIDEFKIEFTFVSSCATRHINVKSINEYFIKVRNSLGSK